MWGWLPSGDDAGGVGQVGRGGDAGSFRVAGILEEILHRAALHAGFGAPGAVGVGIAFEVAVVLRVGVDEHAGGAALLGDVDLDAAEVGAVASDDDLAVQVDVLGGELIEVFEAAVVGVDHFAGHVAGAGRAVEGHHDAGIVLAGVALRRARAWGRSSAACPRHRRPRRAPPWAGSAARDRGRSRFRGRRRGISRRHIRRSCGLRAWRPCGARR